MNMTFEKIAPPPADAPEHPARRAARMIRDLHIENIALIDSGHVFKKDGVDVNTEMRQACVEQIAICDKIIERSEHMDAKHYEPAALMLAEVESTIADAVNKGEVLASILPEVGNYDH